MFTQGKKTIMAVGALAALGLGAGAVAQAGSSPSQSSAAAAPAKASTVKQSRAEPSGPDRDKVQSGDQTTPDFPAGKASAKSADTTDSSAEKPESSGEAAGSEVPNNDGPGGHADEPGSPNADHQFNGKE